MKDPYILLAQKEQDIARVRGEIDALLIVIPLLADTDTDPSWSDLEAQLANIRQNHPTAQNGMADLELYYPFVKNLRLKDEPNVNTEIGIS